MSRLGGGTIKDMDRIEQELRDIEATTDLLERALRLSGLDELKNEVAREIGLQP